jgi:3-hydroxyisobutyrate dehydrogenase-like beta-hydroxyacid dehydrogenase
MQQTKLGIIGMGEAAFNIARGLKKEGLTAITAYDKFWNIEPHAALIGKRAAEAGAVLAESLGGMIAGSDYIMSLVSANLAVPLAKEAAPFLKEGQCYIDMNAASPMTKEEVAAIIAETGAGFVDVAIMGPVPNYGHKVPSLACGSAAEAFTATFNGYGMAITCCGEKPGGASAVKMFRSIFMKGFVMLLLESVLAGHRYGVEDQVLDSIEETLTESDSVRAMINGLLTRGVIHSERREHEMDEVLATLASLGMDSTMSAASKAKLRWCTNMKFRDHFKGVPPADLYKILQAFDQLNAKGPAAR